MNKNVKLMRVTTIPISLKILLRHQLRFMNSYFNVIAVSSPEKELEDVAKEEGVNTAEVTMTRMITPLKDAKAVWDLYKLFKREKPGIVHTHTPKAGLLGMLAARMANVPVRLHTVAGMPLMETKGMKRKMLERAEAFTYSCAGKVYPNSKNLAEFIVDHKFCKSNKLKVLGNGSSNGIDTDYFNINDDVLTTVTQLKRQYQLKANDFVFVFVGRLVKDKGLVELVNSFIHLKKNYPSIKLLMVGSYEPDLDPLPHETVYQIDHHPDIISVGFQNDIRPYLAISHALVFPSYREGFPNVPMQAGCFNLPSIVTDINGCNEIIEEEKNGLLVPVKDQQSLEKAMQRMLTDKLFYERMKANSRRMIVERYDQHHIWKLLLQEYEQHLAQHETLPQLSETAV